MARPRKTGVDAFIDSYLALSPEERPFAMAAIKGADRALQTRQPDPDEEEAGKDLGETIAQAGVKA